MSEDAMTTPTPRTDAMVSGNSNPSVDEYEELSAFTRQLERELAAAKSEIASLKARGPFTLEGAGPDSLDAARYRYLRNIAGQVPDDRDGPMICSGLGDNFDYLRGAECDEAVDAAIAQFGSATHPKEET